MRRARHLRHQDGQVHVPGRLRQRHLPLPSVNLSLCVVQHEGREGEPRRSTTLNWPPNMSQLGLSLSGVSPAKHGWPLLAIAQFLYGIAYNLMLLGQVRAAIAKGDVVVEVGRVVCRFE